MSSHYLGQEDISNSYGYQKFKSATELNSQSYYQSKKRMEQSPKRPIKSRIGDMNQIIEQNGFNNNNQSKKFLSPQKSQINSFDRIQMESNLFNKSQQPQNNNPLQIVTSQARRIEELQTQVEMLKQRECIQLSAEEKNELIADLYSQIESKNILIQRQNNILSTLEREVLDSNAKLRILEIDGEQNAIEVKQYKDELMLQNARNQSLQSNVHELHKTFDQVQLEKNQMSDSYRKSFQDAVEENQSLKNTISELQTKNNQASKELNIALDQVVSEKAQQEILKKQLAQIQQQIQQQLNNGESLSFHMNPLRKESNDDPNSINASYTNQSIILDDFYINTINLSLTGDNLSEKMKKYCDELDSFIEKFLENKKDRVRSKQEMKFFSEMSKIIQFLKSKHIKIYDEFKEQVQIMNKKNDEIRTHMIQTLVHIRILKQSTEITITDMERTIEDMKKEKDRNIKKMEEQDQKSKELDKEITELKKKVNQLSLKIHELNELSADKQRKIDKQENDFKDLEAIYKTTQDQITQLNQKIQKKAQESNTTIYELNEKLEQQDKDQEQLTYQIQELKSELSNLSSNNIEFNEGLQILHQEKECEKQNKKNMEEDLNIIQEKDDIIQEKLQKIQELENQIKALCDKNQGEEILRLNNIINEMSNRESYFQQDINTYKRKISFLENNPDNRKILEDQLNEVKEVNEKQHSTIKKINKQNQDLESQLQELQDKSFISEQELSIIKEKQPGVAEEMKQLIETKDKNTLQINQFKKIVLQMEQSIQIQEKKIKEIEEQLDQKQVLMQMMKIEFEQMDNLHQENLLQEKAFNVKKQEEFEKTILNLIEENKQLNLQRQTLNTSPNYLNKVENFFENENQTSQDQKDQIQKQNKKIKVLVQELDTQIKEKQIFEKRISELETYINLIIENSVEYNSRNQRQIQELKTALFVPQSTNINDTIYEQPNLQAYNVNTLSPNKQTEQNLNMQGNQHNQNSNEEI